MHIEKSLRGNISTIHLPILLMLGLCVGIYLICTTVVISKDGVTFIEYARNLEKDFIVAVKTEYQHPGYPLLIIAVHKVMGVFYKNELWGWIYSAQMVSLLFRLAALTGLYFIGRDLTGAKYGFLSVLVFMLLPKPADYGSDVLSDWSYFFFLVFGMLMLMRGAAENKPLLLAMAGMAAGAGYLIRPECIQIIIYGCMWVAVSWFGFGGNLKKSRVVSLAVLLAVGFAVFSTPYMGLKKAVFPKKELLQFKSLSVSSETYDSGNDSVGTSETKKCNIVYAAEDLVENIGDLLMWFWLLPMLAGIYGFFTNKQKRLQPYSFFIIIFIALNSIMLMWLYCKYGYMSGRHVMPLAAFLSFYIPDGMELLSDWLKRSFAGETRFALNWFLVLLITGICICVPKLVRPINFDKGNYRLVSQWLAEHTTAEDAIAVPDLRMSFYAGRSGLKYDTKLGQEPSQEAKYVVREIKNKSVTRDTAIYGQEVFSATGEKDSSFVIYKNMN